jgi:hypothetical protein
VIENKLYNQVSLRARPFFSFVHYRDNIKEKEL